MFRFIYKYTPLISVVLVVLFCVIGASQSVLAVDYSIQPMGPTSLTGLINSIITWIFNIAIPIAVIMIIYAGLMMVTAGGKPANYEKGKQILKYAIIGLVVIFIGKGFISLIKSILELGQ